MNIGTLIRVGAVSAVVLLAACAGPRVAGKWTEVGVTHQGNIKVSLDTDSIRRNGRLVTFRDKKTVVNPKEERYVNTPRYKTAVGTWEMNCTNKTYRLTALQLLDERGQTVANHSYTASAIRPMSVLGGSIVEKQYQMVCRK